MKIQEKLHNWVIGIKNKSNRAYQQYRYHVAENRFRKTKSNELTFLYGETAYQQKKLKELTYTSDILRAKAAALQALEKRFNTIDQEFRYSETITLMKDVIKELQNVVKTQEEIIQHNTVPKNIFAKLDRPIFKPELNPIKCISNYLKYRKEHVAYETQVKTVREATFNITIGREEQGYIVQNDGTKKYKSDYMISKNKYLEVGNKLIRVYYLADIPAFLGPDVMFRLINSSLPFTVSLFIEPASSAELLKMARQRLSVLEAQQNERYQKGKSSDQKLDKSIDEIKTFVEELVHEVEKGVIFAMYLAIEAETVRELNDRHKKLQDLATVMDLTLNTYTFGQKEAYKNFVPFNADSLKENRVLQSSAVSFLMPFVSKQLNDPDGIFFGVNVYNNNLVFLNPFSVRNHNINIFGVSGGGKSVTAKALANRLYMRGVQIIIIDPEQEYVEFVKQLGGEVIEFSRENGINPFYIDNSDEYEMLDHIATLKTFFSFFIPENRYDGAVLDEALIKLYKGKSSPNFPRLIEYLKNSPMKPYIEVLNTGSLRGIFSSERKLALDSDLIVFDLKELKNDERRGPAMYLLTSLIWNMVNQTNHRKRMLFIDEAHELVRKDKEDVAIFYRELVKKARKRNLGIVSITQDVEDFLNNEYGKAIVTNSETKILLKQSHVTMNLLRDIFPLTDDEIQKLGNLPKGEVIMFRENEHIQMYIQRLPHELELIVFDTERTYGSEGHA